MSRLGLPNYDFEKGDGYKVIDRIFAVVHISDTVEGMFVLDINDILVFIKNDLKKQPNYSYCFYSINKRKFIHIKGIDALIEKRMIKLV